MRRALWLVRHGECRDQVSPEQADRPHDPPLTERGQRQAEQVGEYLRDRDIEAVYASPFLCAAETAHLVADRIDVPVFVEHGLSAELTRDRFGVAPSVLTPRLLAERFDTVDPTHDSVLRPNYPESVEEAADRTRRTVSRLLADGPETILLVGHTTTVGSVVFGFTGQEMTETPYGGVTRLASYPWGWDIDRRSETAHLAGTDDEDG